MATMIYIFFVSKIYEFMDTFIMLLKGNLHQVRASLLPVPLRSADVTRWRCEGDAAARVPPRQHQLHLVDDHQHGAGRRRILLGSHQLFRARHHVPLLPAGHPAGQRQQGARAAATRHRSCARWADVQRRAQSRDKYLWWGRYVTQIQMTQFAANLVQARVLLRRLRAAPCAELHSCSSGGVLPPLLALPALPVGAAAVVHDVAAGPLRCAWTRSICLERRLTKICLFRSGHFYYSKFVASRQAPRAGGRKKAQ
jgi:hypothetical protein